MTSMHASSQPASLFPTLPPNLHPSFPPSLSSFHSLLPLWINSTGVKKKHFVKKLGNELASLTVKSCV